MMLSTSLFAEILNFKITRHSFSDLISPPHGYLERMGPSICPQAISDFSSNLSIKEIASCSVSQVVNPMYKSAFI